MQSHSTVHEYTALAQKPSTADRERVCRALRDQSLTVLWVSAPMSASDEAKSLDLQAGVYVASRFDCIVTISFSKYGNLCMVSHPLGSATLPASADLDGILAEAGWRQVPDEDITLILNETTDDDVLGTFFNVF